ncbi:MAG: hypothetical protein IJV36_06755 [Prevotella sp.]|nr:hypothetical protein [Prevotella sp.]
MVKDAVLRRLPPSSLQRKAMAWGAALRLLMGGSRCYSWNVSIVSE